MNHYYDVLVIGPELAGLFAGGLLARRGFRVLCAREPGAADGYSAGGATLRRSPLPLIGLETPAWRRVLGELNLLQSLRRRLTVQRPAWQLLLPDHRLDGDADRATAEIERELPGAREALDRFFARAEALAHALEPLLGQDVTLPPDGFWERRELGRIRSHLPDPDEDLLPDVPADSPARSLACVPAALSCDLVPPGPVSALRLCDLWRRGSHRLAGGRDALRALLEERIQTHSGEILGQPIAELVIRRGRVTFAVTGGRGEQIGCGFVLAAMPTARLCGLLGAEATPKKLLAQAQAVRPAAWRYTTNLVLAAEGVPEGMAESAFLVADPARPLEEDNALALHFDEPDGSGRAFLSVVALARSEEPTYLAGLGARVRACLVQHLLPFLDRHLVLGDSPHEGENARKMDPVYNCDDLGPLGVGATPIPTGIKNLLLCGRQTLPGLGLEGELVAAWGAARLVSQTEKKKNPLKDEVLLSRG